MGDNRRAHFADTERDEARDFGNEQEMSVHDKAHPTLGPTEEAQDVDRLQKQIVPVPAFNDPGNPVAASGSVNLSINDHPVKHSADYGQAVAEEFGHDDVEHTMSEGSRELQQFDLTTEDDDPQTELAKSNAEGLPSDREEWTKAHWQTHAASLDLGTSGNKEAIRARVEDQEGAEEERANYEKEVNGLTREELDKEAAKLDLNPEEYSTKDALAAAVVAAAYDEDVPPGDKTPTSESQ